MKMHTALRPLALALLGAGLATPAFAGESIELDNGYKLDWRVNSTYTLSTRMENRTIAAYSGGNDGNNNFDKGSLTANRLSLLLDTSITNG
jgi:hypothetical protein